jgi:hypothetical protein
MPWTCEGYGCPPHAVLYPQDRGELKVEILRAGSHDRRFHSKLLAHFCKTCAAGWWREHVEPHSPEAITDSLFSEIP